MNDPMTWAGVAMAAIAAAVSVANSFISAAHDRKLAELRVDADAAKADAARCRAEHAETKDELARCGEQHRATEGRLADIEARLGND